MTITEYESKLKIGSAVKPWNSVDALVSVRVRTNERQELIDKCLNCQELRCWNCLADARIRKQMEKEGC